MYSTTAGSGSLAPGRQVEPGPHRRSGVAGELEVEGRDQAQAAVDRADDRRSIVRASLGQRAVPERPQVSGNVEAGPVRAHLLEGHVGLGHEAILPRDAGPPTGDTRAR